MKTRIKWLLLFAAAMLLLLFWAGGTPPVFASAAVQSGGYRIRNFDVDMTINANRTIVVKNELTVTFENGRHGLIVDLPLEGGVRYTDFEVACNGADIAHRAAVEDLGSNELYSLHFLSVYIGDSKVELKSGVPYRITLNYLMTVPALDEEGYLPIDVLGYGWYEVDRVHAKIAFPDGLNNLHFYSGSANTVGDELGIGAAAVRTGNTLEFVSDDWSEYGGLSYQGITIDFSFGAGVLSVSPDLTPLWVALIGLAVLAAAVCVKLFVCRQPALVRTVNLSAPDEMDPLLMGKLIDDKVDGEDFGALVFYLADKDYLTIDLSQNSDDPTLIRTDKELSDDLPEHCKTFYNGLFPSKKTDRVQVSSLRCRFYRTADKVKSEVSDQAGRFFEQKGNVVLVLFGLFTVLSLGGFIWLYSMLKVISGYHDFAMFIGCLLAFVPSAFGGQVSARRWYKWKKAKLALPVLGGWAVGLLLGMFCGVFQSALFSFLAKFLAALFSACAGAVCGFFVCRTKEYNDKLGQILGFKQFIEVTERDKVEFMLKDDPTLFYRVLPYAQVLGVTDAWTDKFKDLDMRPPSYVYGHDPVFTCVMWSSLSRSMGSSMGRSMTSRPSSSSKGSGSFGSGSGGGFGGGGFGGGGGRSF